MDGRDVQEERGAMMYSARQSQVRFAAFSNSSNGSKDSAAEAQVDFLRQPTISDSRRKKPYLEACPMRNRMKQLFTHNGNGIKQPQTALKNLVIQVLPAIGGGARRIRATRVISVLSIAMAVRTLTLRTLLMGLLRSAVSKIKNQKELIT